MLSERELSAAIGTTAYDAEGHKIGTVEHFFVDDRTGAPTWVAVTTGLFGTRHSVVPASEATFADGGLRLPVGRDAVKSAPHPSDAGHLDAPEESELRRHYGLTDLPAGAVARAAPPPRARDTTSPEPPSGSPVSPPARTADEPSGRHAAAGPTEADRRDHDHDHDGARDGGHDHDSREDPRERPAPDPSVGSPGDQAWSPTSTGTVPVGAVRGGDEPPGPVAVPEHEVAAARAGSAGGRDERAPGGRGDDGSMTRTEEQLRVATERVPVARVRLVKYVVTEEVQVTVPVRREEVRLEEVPLGEDAAAAPGESLVPAGAEAGAGSAAEAGLPDEIVLHAERPVIGVEVVPVERVRLRTEVVRDDERVTERLEREQIAVDRS